jgi:hypothetical protein
VIVISLWLPRQLVWRLLELGARMAGPLDTLGLLSYPFYSLLALFLLMAWELNHVPAAIASTRDQRPA